MTETRPGIGVEFYTMDGEFIFRDWLKYSIATGDRIRRYTDDDSPFCEFYEVMKVTHEISTGSHFLIITLDKL